MKTAMILAAGSGERLRPLTHLKPKAMCMVQGKPLIEHHVANLAKAGFCNILINHAHLGSQIRQHLGSGERWQVKIKYLPEPPGGLETGGGLFNACQYLSEEPFLSINADIYADFDLSAFKLPMGSLAHLILGPNPPHQPKGNFGLTPDAKLSLEAPLHTYLGLAIYHPKAFAQCKIGRYSVIPLIKGLMEKELVSGELYLGSWVDIGSLDRLRAANQEKDR